MIPFGNRIEMLVDDYLIAEKSGAVFRLTHPENRGKILGFDEEWEGEGSLAMTVFEDDQNIKCYYRGFPTHENDASVLQTSCLAVSDDGLHFRRCPVNEIDYRGIRENNIVRMGTVCHNFAPFYDGNPDCRPDERYKAIGGTKPVGGIWVFASPDGIHWKELADHPVITRGAFDSMNMAFWDPHARLYRSYSRYMDDSVKLPCVPHACRAIQSCTSEDFIHWTDPVPNEYEGGLTDQLYTNAARPVPGAEHILISIPMRYQEIRKKYPEYTSGGFSHNGVSDAVLMTSRDGVHWDRTVRDAWLSGGLYDHEWTQRCFITAGGIIVRGDYFYFYTEQNYMWDDDGIWVYALPKYRLMSLYADGDGGSFRTKPLRFLTDEFFLNYATSAYGYVKVTLYDEAGTELYDSGEIFGNELSHRICCEGLTNRIGSMKVELKEAHLYALGSRM